MLGRSELLRVSLVLVGLSVSVPALALDLSEKDVSSKLHGDLGRILRAAARDELVPVKAIMSEQVPQARIE